MNPSISVGVFDWGHFPANDDFYPQDLPAEWRLSFYANEFDGACISPGTLIKKSDDLGEWLEDLDQNFKLSFYLQSKSQLQLVTDAVVASSINVSNLIYDTGKSELTTYLNSNRQVLCSAGVKVAPRIIGFTGLWRPNTETTDPSAIALFPGDASLRQYRQWIEQWLQDVDDKNELTLWLEGETTGYQTLVECRSLVELMGF